MGFTHFASVLTDTLPEWLEDTVKGFDTVRGGCLGQSSKSQGGDGSHFLLFIHQACTHQ
jgi:hypothetical protein